MRFILFLFSILFLTSCQESAEQSGSNSSGQSTQGLSGDKIHPQESDWTKSGMIGKVKEVKRFRKTFNHSGEEGKEIIRQHQVFNEKGMLVLSNDYDPFGKVKTTKDIVYDAEGKLISFSTNHHNHSTREKYVRTDSGAFVKSIKGNVLLASRYLSLDKHDRILVNKLISEKGDTSIDRFTYNNRNRIVEESRYRSVTGQTRILKNSYQYNIDGFLTEETIGNSNDNAQVNLYEYDGKKLLTRQNLLKGKLRSSTTYDDFGNDALVEFSQKGKVRKSDRYTYQYDDHNNWVERRKDIRINTTETANYRPSTIERQEIVYF